MLYSNLFDVLVFVLSDSLESFLTLIGLAVLINPLATNSVELAEMILWDNPKKDLCKIGIHQDYVCVGGCVAERGERERGREGPPVSLKPH